MRWLRRHVVDDDGPADAAVGIPAHSISLSRLPPSSDFRLALTDEQGAVISSIDLDRGDLYDTRQAISNQLHPSKDRGRG